MNQIPAEWRSAKIVHLGPVAREISPETGFNFPGAALCLSLQGWLREWNRKGLIQPSPFPEMNNSFPENTAVFLSIEDLGFDQSLIDPLRSLFPLLILTKGNAGAEIYWQEKTIPIPVEPKMEVDPTGAGDIFATAFMINYALKGKKLIESAQVASALAAISVTRSGIEGIPTEAEIQSIQEVH
jgi:sugar/nucleoside kinase (ribokinase family)